MVGSYLNRISYVENIRPTHISFAVIFTGFILTYTLVEIRKMYCFSLINQYMVALLLCVHR